VQYRSIQSAVKSMNVLLKILGVVALLTAMTGLAGCASQTPGTLKNPSGTEDKKDQPTIAVLLPDIAQVTLKNGQSKSGRLTALTQKQIQITPGGGSPVSIPIDQIKDKKVTFKGQVKYVSNGAIKIRGEDKTKPVLDTWQGIPLSDFKVQNTETAEVKITFLDKTKQKGIQQVAANSGFRLEQIQLESVGGKMTLKVTAFDK
jgi:ribosome maturation factor RimP